MHPWKKLNKHENQDRGADKPITVQEQRTAWKSRAEEYGPVGQERKGFFSFFLPPVMKSGDSAKKPLLPFLSASVNAPA
jgi:hypothetical protein